MLKVAAAKIKSALKTPRSKSTVFIALALLCVTLPFVFYRPAGAVLHIGSTDYQLTIASTPATRQVGLGGRQTMSQTSGMLFVFNTSAVECFWMKDMQFPLDIIWVNPEKKVVHVEQHLTPATYPKTFCPSTPAKYVIELRAGEAAKRHIATGQKLDF